MILFSNPGRVAVFETPALPISVSMTCWNSKVFKAIITSVSIANQGGYQFMHSLRDYIYIYVFNERIGQLEVSGVAFMGDCNNSGPGESGIEKVLQYYYKMRATRRLSPVVVQLGATTFYGFLLAANAAIVDSESGLGRFSFKFHFPPDDIASGGEIICDDPFADEEASIPGGDECGGDFDCINELHTIPNPQGTTETTTEGIVTTTIFSTEPSSSSSASSFGGTTSDSISGFGSTSSLVGPITTASPPSVL